MQELAAHDPVSRVFPLALARQSLAWAALAAVLGSAVGFAATFSSSSWPVWASPLGGLLASLSLLGVASLLGRDSWAARVGVMLLLLWLVASLSFVVYFSLWRQEQPQSPGGPPFAFVALLHASLWGGSLATLPFALGSLFGGRTWRLGVVLLVLSVPGSLLLFLDAPLAGADISISEIETLVGSLTSPAASVGVPEAVLWASVGVLLFTEARQRALGKALKEVAEQNRHKALRLYEEGLGRGDPSALDEVVSKDFRDLGGGHRGKQGMERIVSELRSSYPDLSVSVEDQETEGDLVRTRLTISGTDRGSGVMWYPPTGRHVSLEAEFVDRFSGGLLVEHAGWADTEGLLRQLGHHEEV
jgi:predicted ester cyclase